jgi:CheY-like chemotaxis protein
MPWRKPMIHPITLAFQAIGAATTSFATFLLAQAPPAVADHPTPVLVALCVGVASVVAPGLIREGGEFLRRKQARQAQVEDRDFQAQLDANKARSDAHKADSDRKLRELADRAAAAEAAAAEARGRVERLEADYARERRRADEAEAVSASALARLRNQVDVNAAGIGVALGTADAAVDALRSGDGIPAAPAAEPVPGTDWPLACVFEDDPSSTRQLCRLLASAGYRVKHAASLTDALMLLPENPSLMVVDLNLVGGNGEIVVRKAREAGSKARIVCYCGWIDPDTELRLKALGVERVILKTAGGAEAVMAAIRGT